MLTLKPIIY